MNKLLFILIALSFLAGFILFWASVALVLCFVFAWRIIIFGVPLGGMSRGDALMQLGACAVAVICLKALILFCMSKVRS